VRKRTESEARESHTQVLAQTVAAATGDEKFYASVSALFDRKQPKPVPEEFREIGFDPENPDVVRVNRSHDDIVELFGGG